MRVWNGPEELHTVKAYTMSAFKRHVSPPHQRLAKLLRPGSCILLPRSEHCGRQDLAWGREAQYNVHALPTKQADLLFLLAGDPQTHGSRGLFPHLFSDDQPGGLQG